MKTKQEIRNERKLENKTNYAIASLLGARGFEQRKIFLDGINRLKNK